MSESNNPPPAATPEQIASARATWIAAGHDPARFDASFSVGTPTPPNTDKAARMGDLSADQVASARVTWIKAGLPAAQFDAAMAAPQGGATEGAPTGTEYVPGTGTEPLTEQQAAALEDVLRAAGKSETEIAAEMAAHGMTADERTPEQIEHDREHGITAAWGPEDYRLDWRAAGVLHDRQVGEMQRGNEGWGQFMSAMAVPPGLGTSLAEHMIRGNTERGGMNEWQRGLWQQEQQAALIAAGNGMAGAQAIKDAAGAAIKWAIDNATDKARVLEVIQAMKDSGALHDAYVLKTLANVGRNLESWRAGV